MLKNEEKLFDEFKRVDRICGDMFSCQHGVSKYIEEMERVSAYSRHKVPLWDQDYRSLKRVRWLRNQIVHETSAPDCSDGDAIWLEDFHARLLTQQDPLAILSKVSWAQEKNTRPRAAQQRGAFHTSQKSGSTPRKPDRAGQENCVQDELKESDKSNTRWLIAVVIVLIAVFALVFLSRS